ncbi:hypothetical protein [Aquibacillus kalidii]|uniref:hypothetical protein n=1 Tax=Aquibacillus kalidii TaxID=2762597 RepID=UPI001648C3AE|nr:hypothetical protein [Aquibacillus kalidii]
MATLKFLSHKQIHSYYIENITTPLAKVRKQAYEQRVPFLFKVEEQDGKYFLMSGFRFYDSYKQLESQRLIPCLVKKANNTEPDRIVKVLKQGVNHEGTNWRFKYHLINRLVKVHRMDCQSIAFQLGKDESYIRGFLLDSEIPDYFKERAIRSNTSDLIQSIYLHPAIPDRDKLDFYQLAISGNLSNWQFYLLMSSYYSMYTSIYGHPFAHYRLVF